MRGLLIIVLFVFVSACSPTPEQLLSKVQEIDFPTEAPYSVRDYRGSVYIIEYEGNRYIGWMHPDSIFFSRLERFYSKMEKDSLNIKEGEVRGTELLTLDTSLAHNLARFCSAFKCVWRISPRDIYLENLTVDDNTHSVWLFIQWKKTNQAYLVLISNSFSDALNFSQESKHKNDYKRISSNLYYRVIKEEK